MLEVKRLIGEGMTGRSIAELIQLLAHADMRIRQEAQFALAERALAGQANEIVPKLVAVAEANEHRLARLHAIWALGQIGRRSHPDGRAPRCGSSLADADSGGSGAGGPECWGMLVFRLRSTG